MAMGPGRSLGATLQVIVTHCTYKMSIRHTERVCMRISCGFAFIHSNMPCRISDFSFAHTSTPALHKVSRLTGHSVIRSSSTQVTVDFTMHRTTRDAEMCGTVSIPRPGRPLYNFLLQDIY